MIFRMGEVFGWWVLSTQKGLQLFRISRCSEVRKLQQLERTEAGWWSFGRIFLGFPFFFFFFFSRG